jgi:Tfp pilus assembly protein PilF
MKKLFIILILISGVVSCEKAEDTEFPLILPAAAEPSSKMYNDRGIEFFRKGDFKEAVIAFVQARTADHTAGEIHFNLALTRLKLGDQDKARDSFKLAVKHSYGNTQILESPLLNKTLGMQKK